MKKLTIITVIFITGIFLVGCTKNRFSQSTNSATGEIIIDSGNNIVKILSGNNSQQYLSGYSGDTVIITEENSGAIIIQSGNELLYRNNIYGFQVKLGKEWKGSKICQTDPFQKYAIKTIHFFLDTNNTKNSNKQDISSCMTEGYTSIAQFSIYDYSGHYNLINTPGMDGTTGELEQGTYDKNNKYYFTFGLYPADEKIHKLIPSLECHPIKAFDNSDTFSCPGWKDKIFISGFTTFDLR